ncbi:MAG: hypothetical protein CMP23_13815 [Rickettsiales bacterium]|nr:hypothetical protein [Rickettsiales bacterium]|tara:strand:+ start:1102 stop:1869 length:768 start_codon:yes stop_codon:yes gene_type:complete
MRHVSLPWLLLLALILGQGCESNGDDDDAAAADDDDSSADDDVSHPTDDDDDSAQDRRVQGSVDVITLTTDQLAEGISVFELGNESNVDTTDDLGCWELRFPIDQETATVVASAPGYEEARYHLDLRWQSDRTEDMIFFNIFRSDEIGPFMDQIFGLSPDPNRAILEVGAKSAALGPRLAGATIHTDRNYEMVVTANDNPGETNVTTDDGTNFFMNIEPGPANVWVEGPDGEPCTGLSPVEVVAGTLTHVIFLCN